MDTSVYSTSLYGVNQSDAKYLTRFLVQNKPPRGGRQYVLLPFEERLSFGGLNRKEMGREKYYRVLISLCCAFRLKMKQIVLPFPKISEGARLDIDDFARLREQNN